MTDLTQQVVITGAGLVTPLGLSRRETWDAISRGRCGMGRMPAMESPVSPEKDGGQAPDLPQDFLPDAPREIRYLRWTIDQALADAACTNSSAELPYLPHCCGVMLGTTLHGMRAGGRFLRTGDFASLQTFLATSVLQRATEHLNISGLAATTCSACSSSLGSIALAVSLLQSGEFDLIIAGGYDPISEYAYAGFSSLRLVAEGPLRPFGHNRQGMKLAEGYAIVVLERADSAKERGVKPLATILGCGESADAHHLTQPHPEGEGAARAMQSALTEANLEPADVDLAAAHATGTPDNDAGEYAALSRVFGQQLETKPVIAFKSYLGHTLGAAGAAELILSATAMEQQIVPTSLNAHDPDPAFTHLRLAAFPPPARKLRVTLNTSLGFGGANTSVVLGRAPAAPAPARRRSTYDVMISGIGVVLPGLVGRAALAAHIRATETSDSARRRLRADTGPVPEDSVLPYLNARRVRRMSDYVKLSLAATSLACKDAGVDANAEFLETCSVILGSTHGAANYCQSYYKQIVDEGIAAANPMLFAEGVPNAAAAHLSLMLSLKGACQTVIGSRTAGLDALRLASTRIASGQWSRAIVGAAEEYSDVINQAYRHCGLYAGATALSESDAEAGFVVGAGAVTLILESRESLERRGGNALGRVVSSSSRRFASSEAINATLQLLHALRDPAGVISSANNTWIDRAEAVAIRRANPAAKVSTLYGTIAETFSVGALAGIAAGLTGDRPEVKQAPFAVLSTDYTGLVAGTLIEISK